MRRRPPGGACGKAAAPPRRGGRDCALAELRRPGLRSVHRQPKACACARRCSMRASGVQQACSALSTNRELTTREQSVPVVCGLLAEGAAAPRRVGPPSRLAQCVSCSWKILQIPAREICAQSPPPQFNGAVLYNCIVQLPAPRNVIMKSCQSLKCSSVKSNELLLQRNYL